MIHRLLILSVTGGARRSPSRNVRQTRPVMAAPPVGTRRNVPINSAPSWTWSGGRLVCRVARSPAASQWPVGGCAARADCRGVVARAPSCATSLWWRRLRRELSMNALKMQPGWLRYRSGRRFRVCTV